MNINIDLIYINIINITHYRTIPSEHLWKHQM